MQDRLMSEMAAEMAADRDRLAAKAEEREKAIHMLTGTTYPNRQQRRAAERQLRKLRDARA